MDTIATMEPEVPTPKMSKPKSPKKTPARRPLETRKDRQESEGRSEGSIESEYTAEEKRKKKKEDIHALTYTTRPRKANFLSCCFVCDDNCEEPKKKKTMGKVKKEKQMDGTNEVNDEGIVKKEENGEEASKEMENDEGKVKKEENGEEMSKEMENNEGKEKKEENGEEVTKKMENDEGKVKKEENGEEMSKEMENNEGKVKKEENGDDASMEEKEDEAEAYITCAFKNCSQVMHKKCADEFVCSEYSPNQAMILFQLDGPVCPAHFCWHCYDERMKNSSRFGRLIDCEKCMRSFHIECLPAGCKITSTLGKRKSFVCHEHSIGTKNMKIASKTRTKYCTECEEFCLGDEVSKDDPNWENHPRRVMECNKCTNIFHRECAFREVRGEGSEEYEFDTCPYCLTGGTIVSNQYVQAYYKHKMGKFSPGYYPGVAVALTDIPSDVKKQLKPNLGLPGWIPVQWMWDEYEEKNKYYYNLIPKSHVQRMTVECRKNISEKKWKDEVLKASANFTAPTRPMDYDAMRKTIKIIHGNVYTEGVLRIQEKKDLQECLCQADKNGVKCNDSDCINRASYIECPKSCDQAEGIKCGNRELQRADRPTDMYEVKEAENGKGLGVFATMLIKKGKFLFEYAGEVITPEEKERRIHEKSVLRSNDEWTYMMDLKGTMYTVDARYKGSDARYVNNSCDPNCEVSCTEVPFKILNADSAMYEPRLKMMAIRDIQKGEEVTFAYEISKSKKMALDLCKCGAAKCKGKLGKKNNDDDSDDERFDVREEISMDDDEDLSTDSECDSNEEDEKENKRGKKKTVKKVKKNAAKNGNASNKRRASMGGPSGSRNRVPPKKGKESDE